ncbi:hypothetical protein ACIOG4_37540 [Streptomyces microflavus]|uniref:hypothetical protein n=1 Tax=Streptomyces microflavus TaxID=1919 RepID=UPI0037F4C624
MTTVVARLMNGALPYEETVLRDRAVHCGLMWSCPCTAVNGYAVTACAECGAPRLWTTDTTPSPYGQLLEDLRDALKDWVDARPRARRPAAVGFRVTTQYDDGPAWTTWAAPAYFTNSPDSTEYLHGFDRTLVADALVEISDFEQPQTGDRLIVVIPAL